MWPPQKRGRASSKLKRRESAKPGAKLKDSPMIEAYDSPLSKLETLSQVSLSNNT